MANCSSDDVEAPDVAPAAVEPVAAVDEAAAAAAAAADADVTLWMMNVSSRMEADMRKSEEEHWSERGKCKP